MTKETIGAKKLSGGHWQAGAKFFVLILLCLTVQGCGAAYREKASSLAATGAEEDYGPMPTEYEAAIKHFLGSVFALAPDDVLYSNWKAPSRAIIPDADYSTNPIQGWRVDVHIVLRNKNKDDIILKKYQFFFVNKKIYAYRTPSNITIWWDYIKK
jgi:hypothetical protein